MKELISVAVLIIALVSAYALILAFCKAAARETPKPPARDPHKPRF